jgi:hypothetical protein
MRTFYKFIFLSFLNISTSLANDTLYVNINAIGLNNGTSWSNAFTSLKSALEGAQYNDQIWIAKGTYTPPPPQSPSDGEPFVIPNGVQIYGGFAATESSLLARDIALNETVLAPHPMYPYLISYIPVADTTTSINGITFKDGRFSPLFQTLGGAIYMKSTDPLMPVYVDISDCKFYNNTAFKGGAIRLESKGGRGGISLKNCIFNGNATDNFGSAGGAVYLECGENPQYPVTIQQCTFTNNESFDDTGALYFESDDTLAEFILHDCSFLNNNSNLSGAFSFKCKKSKKTNIENCLFKDNKGGTTVITGGGGGAVYGSDLVFSRCYFQNNRALRGGAVAGSKNNYVSCVFIKNSAYYGGAVGFFNPKLYNGINKFYNCTFYGNYAVKGSVFVSPIINIDSIFNCIFFNNKTRDISTIFLTQYGPSNVYISNSLMDIADCNAFISSIDVIYGPDTITCGPNNLYLADPLFVDTLEDNYALKSCSPGINFGDLSVLPAFISNLDLNGNPRVLELLPDAGAFEQEMFRMQVFETIKAETLAGNNDGAITLDSIQGNNAPFSVLWSTGQTGMEISNLSKGTYQVTVTNTEGCAATYQYKVDLSTATADQQDASDQITVGPNPFSTHIQVTLNASFPGSVLKMYNQLGDLVLDQKLSLGGNTFSVEGLPTGLYYWVFRAHGEVIKTGKLVKVK